MPITAFQKKVLATIKVNRSPDSYVAGGTAIQRGSDSVRFSSDIDFFHDADQAVNEAYRSDRATLTQAGYTFETQISQPSFFRATIGKSGEFLKLEWVRDTAFRYFPVVSDDELGYRLHDADLAINKCLALANRSVVRDAIDILLLDHRVMSLAAMISAGCGKDPGFTPSLMLDMIQRHLTFTPEELAAESLTQTVNPVALKRDLINLVKRTTAQLKKIPAKHIGCLYLDKSGNILSDLTQLDPQAHTAHFGSVRGSWPRLVD